jgi:hypothetical protein
MKRDPIEIVQIAVPVLIEVVAVCLFIGMIAVWAALASGG